MTAAFLGLHIDSYAIVTGSSSQTIIFAEKTIDYGKSENVGPPVAAAADAMPSDGRPETVGTRTTGSVVQPAFPAT